jgi:hypothetical protein
MHRNIIVQPSKIKPNEESFELSKKYGPIKPPTAKTQ